MILFNTCNISWRCRSLLFSILQKFKLFEIIITCCSGECSSLIFRTWFRAMAIEAYGSMSSSWSWPHRSEKLREPYLRSIRELVMEFCRGYFAITFFIRGSPASDIECLHARIYRDQESARKLLRENWGFRKSMRYTNLELFRNSHVVW